MAEAPGPERDVFALAARAGVEPAFVAELIELGILPAGAGRTRDGDVRRIRVVDGLERGGIPRAVLAEAIARGALALDFVEQPSYDRFSAYEDETFEQLAARIGAPVEVLLVIREAMGSPAAVPADRVRAMELAVVPFIESVMRAKVGPELIERTIRVIGDGMRRIAETEADWWRSEILGPLFRSGASSEEIGRRTEAFATAVGPLTDEAVLAIYHGQQAQAWLRNIFDGFEGTLAQAGLQPRLERRPAIAFFDVTGYSRLTEERGDASAALLAGRVARLVQRESAEHAGRTIKWLGDGVMLFFPDAGAAVLAALDMMDAIEREGLPPGHAGIHTGPVLFQ